jgi:hypothetical protein
MLSTILNSTGLVHSCKTRLKQTLAESKKSALPLGILIELCYFNYNKGIFRLSKMKTKYDMMFWTIWGAIWI